MQKYTTEEITFKDQTFTLYCFSVPMFHHDWHTAEELGLVYIGFDSSGNDYWDYTMDFCTKDMETVAKEWRERAYW